MHSQSRAILSISDLRLWVHLGCSEQEKYHHQCVSFDISFSFFVPPKAIESDDLADTYCYFKASQAIKNLVNSKEFNLIEHLAAEVYNEILKDIKQQQSQDIISLTVTVKKLSPPVSDIHGYVSFTYSG